MLIAHYKCDNFHVCLNFLFRPLGNFVFGVLILASHNVSVHLPFFYRIYKLHSFSFGDVNMNVKSC
jgi:hypothetical protein